MRYGFASYVYLPKLRDRVVLETAIRDAVTKLDPSFGYADRFDEASGTYSGLTWAKAPPIAMPASAVLVRPDVALDELWRIGSTAAVAGTSSVGTTTAGVPPEGSARSRPAPRACREASRAADRNP